MNEASVFQVPVAGLASTTNFICGVEHEWVEFSKVIPLRSGDRVGLKFKHNRNSHTVFGMDRLGEEGAVYDEDPNYNLAYMEAISPRFTV